jgi:hypothetical protein
MNMRGIRLIPMGLILLSSAIANAQSKPADAVDADAAPEAVAPAPAIVFPKRPAELPPQAPKVTCHGDELTISADNSALSEILAAVKGCTGAKIEIPEGAVHVRSFEELGPGPVRAVLDQLLSGTPYNYVIQSSDTNPLKVETVMMSMRVADTDKPGAAAVTDDLPATSGRRKWQHMQRFDKPDPSTVNEDGTVNVEAAAAAEKEGSLPGQPADPNAGQPSANPATPTPDASATAVAEAPPITPVAPPIVAPGSNADPAAAVQDRIAQMQQMFNQRQQMLKPQGQSAPPNN